jgi:hypothetical protein
LKFVKLSWSLMAHGCPPSALRHNILLLQLQGRQLPILNIDRTAQPNAAMVLAYLLEGAGELEELASSWVKATSGSAGGACVCGAWQGCVKQTWLEVTFPLHLYQRPLHSSLHQERPGQGLSCLP